MKAFLAGLVAALCLASSMAAEAGPREQRGAPAGDFDLYILALSWSPGFCASGGDRKSPEQCSDGANLGFVVHGLWPQYEAGYPSQCGPEGRNPQRRDLDIVRGVMPTEALARHEWRKHGTCSGLAPSAYFSAVAEAYASVAMPRDLPSQARPLEIERAFAAANPALRTDMMAVDCGRSDEGRIILQEVRICMTRDLRGFRRCPDEVERDTCRAPSIDIPPLR